MPNRNVQATAEGMSRNKSCDSAIAAAMRRLEQDIIGLHSMALILGDMLDQDLESTVERQDVADNFTILLNTQQLELLSFAWNDVIERANRVEKAFHAACKGEVLQ